MKRSELSRGQRITVWAVLLSFVSTGPLQGLALASRMTSVGHDDVTAKRQRQLGGAVGGERPLPVMLVPDHVTSLHAGPVDPGRMFDLDAGTAFDVDAANKASAVRVRVSFAGRRRVSAVALLGGFDGVLSVHSETEAPEAGGPRYAPVAGATKLTAAASGWRRVAFPAPVESRALLVEYTPSGPHGPREIAFWGESDGDALAVGTDADAIRHARWPGAEVVSFSPREVVASHLARERTGRFTARIDATPARYGRAFLVYELEGLTHFSGARRSINALPVAGGEHARAAAGGHLQVEEIAPAWLRSGDNEIRFEPLAARVVPEYRVRNLRVVLAPAGGVFAVDPRGEKVVRFERPMQLHEAFVRPAADASRALTFVAPGRKLAASVPAGTAGWHRVDLEALGVVEDLAVEGDAAEVLVAASPAGRTPAGRAVVSHPLHGECVGTAAHVRGFVALQNGVDVSSATLVADGKRTSLSSDGSFAFDVKVAPGKAASAKLRLATAGGVAEKTVSVGPCLPERVAHVGLVEDEDAPFAAWARAGQRTVIRYAGAELDIPPGALDRDVRITLRPLLPSQVPPVRGALYNVTPGAGGMRLGPHGLTFKEPVKLTLPYDRRAFPAGMREDHVYGFYFDEAIGRWQRVDRGPEAEGHVLSSLTTHFTDFINATLAQPDAPGVAGFDQNAIKGIALANPQAGVTLINPPTGDSRGSARVAYPIETPPARNGVGPDLAITYDSDAKEEGTLGLGWSFALPRIERDTKFGVPRYERETQVDRDGNGRIEDDRFLLDGAEIVPTSPGANEFRRRIEGAFERIRRLPPPNEGSGAESWEVTRKDGTRLLFGSTAFSRLAHPDDALRVFTWHLDHVIDKFGNEMLVSYERRGVEGPAPWVQLYPKKIAYTGNRKANLAPGYTVTFGWNERPLLFEGQEFNQEYCKGGAITGRPGFQVRTTRLLTSIETHLERPQRTRVRRYAFKYKPGDLGKCLLSSVEMEGANASGKLYAHTFEYERIPRNPDGTPAIFGKPRVLPLFANEAGQLRTGGGLGQSQDVMAGIGASIGIGITKFFKLTFGGSGFGGDDKTRLVLTDLNGDGTLDLWPDSGAVNFSNRLADGFTFEKLGARTAGAFGLNGQSGWRVDGSAALYGAGASGGYGRSTSEDEKTMADVNGDGFVDLVSVTDGKLQILLNNGNKGFRTASSPALAIAGGDLSARGDELRGKTASDSKPINPIVRWVAPFGGRIRISGLIQKLQAGGDGVVARIYENGDERWSRDIAGSDVAATEPNLELQIAAGDRIYTRLHPKDDGTADLVRWEPRIEYLATSSGPLSADERAAQEPFGAPVYVFDQKEDFRLAGNQMRRWVASSDGEVVITGAMTKLSTSDAITARVVHDPRGSAGATIVFEKDVSADAVAAQDLTRPGRLLVKAGDTLVFRADTDAQIDPKRVDWRPRVEYVRFCREKLDGEGQQCGEVICAPEPGGTGATCNIENDPSPDLPIPEDVLVQEPSVHFQAFQYTTGAATKSHIVKGGGTVSVSGTVSFTGGPKGTGGGTGFILVQGVNRLYKKVELAQPVLTAPFVAEDVQVPADEPQLFVTVVATSSTVASATATIGGTAIPVNVRVRDPKYDAPTARPVYVKPVQLPDVRDEFSGGYHRWFYGDFDGNQTFTESALNAPDLSSVKDAPERIAKATFMFALPGERQAGTASEPAWLTRGDDGFVAAGVQSSTRAAAFSGPLRSLRKTETWTGDYSFSVPGVSTRLSFGESHAELDFFDFNGDRLPDSVTSKNVRFADGSDRKEAFEGTLRFGNARSLSGDGGALRTVVNRTAQLGFGGTYPFWEKKNAAGDTVSGIKGGFTLGRDVGFSGNLADLVDINGDGLVDRVRRDGDKLLVQLNLGYEWSAPVELSSVAWKPSPIPNDSVEIPGLDSNALETAQNLLKGLATTDHVPLAPKLQTSSTTRWVDSTNNNVGVGVNGVESNFGVSAGAGWVFGQTRTISTFADINGDGLADEVMRVPGQDPLYVKLNLGDQFDTAQAWSIPGWQGGIPGEKFQFFGSADALEFQRRKGWTVNVGFEVCFLLCVGISGFRSTGEGWSNLAMQDVDGDGNLDHVLKLNGQGTLQIKPNQVGKTNLLKKVVRPLGGAFTLEYERQGNTVAMPQNQWVLHRVDLVDAQGWTSNETYDYGNSGYFDRLEQTSFGYAKVIATRADGSQVETRFANRDFYRKGLPTELVERAADGRLYRKEIFTYEDPKDAATQTVAIDGWFFPAERARETRMYEKTTSDETAAAPKSTKETRTWDEYGGLRKLHQEGEPGNSADDVVYDVTYFRNLDAYIHLPEKVTATSLAGTMLRERRATFGPRGELDTVTNVVIGGKKPDGSLYTGASGNPVWDYDFDAAGNLEKVVDPKGYTLRYGYDTDVATYLTSLTDVSFGYVAQREPNLLFGGEVSMTDINGHKVEYEHDDYGRLTKVWGPDDPRTGAPTIVMSYGDPMAAKPGQPVWARTDHKDVTSTTNDPITTVTFADGWERVIQTKKDHEKDTGTGTVVGMTVSGRVHFTPRGFVDEVGQPRFVGADVPATTYVDQPALYPTVTTFDELGRELTVSRPSEAATPEVTTTSYGFETLDGQVWWITLVEDAEAKQRTVYRDVGGSIVAVKERNTLGGSLRDLVTRYTYDPLDQLLEVKDAKNNITRATYDTVGRMVSLASPDAGLTEWSFDLGGNLAVKQTARLRARSPAQAIRYQYDFNRLKTIDYPDTTDVVFEYGGPADAGDGKGNRAGRVKRETSEAGVRTFAYDRLGYVASKSIEYPRLREPHLGPYRHTIGFDHDSFGRLLKVQMPGPGSEVVSYGYDAGGNVTRAVGVNTMAVPGQPNRPDVALYLLHMGYDEFGQRVRMVQGNGVQTVMRFHERTRRLKDIDADHRDLQLLQQGKPARPFQRLRYQYDRVGNIKVLENQAPYDQQMNGSVLVGTSRQSFVYDDLYQLKTADGTYQERRDWRQRYSLTFDYDEIGNIKKKEQESYRDVPQGTGWRMDQPVREQWYKSAYTYDGPRPHAPTKIDESLWAESMPWTRALRYDASGNQTGWLYRGSNERAVAWTADDRVAEIRENNQSKSIIKYAGAGERAVHLHYIQDLEETAYIDQHAILRGGKYMTKHVFAGDVRIASKMDADWLQVPPVLYYHSDHLQSTTFVSDQDQALTQHNEYFPTGELWADETDSRFQLRKTFLFNGKELDIGTGLYHYGARAYDARQSLWASPDPILADYFVRKPTGAHPANLALYTHTWNNPIVLRDRDGRETGDVSLRTSESMAEAIRRRPVMTPAQRQQTLMIAAGLALIGLGGAYALALLEGGTAATAVPAAVGAGTAAGSNPRVQQALTQGTQVLSAQGPAVAAEAQAAGQAVPQLVAGPGRQMIGQAISLLKDIAPDQRVEAFRNFANQIMRVDSSWQAVENRVGDATVFIGEGAAARALVFDRAGRMFLGLAADVYRIADKKIEIAFDLLKEVK